MPISAITNHWFGFVAFPFDQLPKLAVHDGVIYPSGYCGSGTVWARWLGQKAAHMVLADLDEGAFQEHISGKRISGRSLSHNAVLFGRSVVSATSNGALCDSG